MRDLSGRTKLGLAHATMPTLDAVPAGQRVSYTAGSSVTDPLASTPGRRDSLPFSSLRCSRAQVPVFEEFWPASVKPGKPRFRGQSGAAWRVADPSPVPELARRAAYYKEEPPVEVSLPFASVSRDGVKTCALLHSERLSLMDAPIGDSRGDDQEVASRRALCVSLHQRLGSTLLYALPSLRWHRHINPCTAPPQHRHEGTVCAVAFAPDDSVIATGGRDQSVRLWEANSLTCLGTLNGHSAVVNAVCFASDGLLLASGSGSADKSSKTDHSVCLWDVTKRSLSKELLGHTAAVASLDFAPVSPAPHLLGKRCSTIDEAV